MLAGRRRAFAQAGEDAAVEALRRRGYRVLARNVRLRRGELDVVAEEGGDLVFVEVKSRRSVAYGTPAEAVGFQKQRTLVRLAAAYLARTRGRDAGRLSPLSLKEPYGLDRRPSRLP